MNAEIEKADLFEQYKSQYPMLDVYQEYEWATEKLQGKRPGRFFFEKWLKFAADDYLPPPKPKPKPARVPKTWEP